MRTRADIIQAEALRSLASLLLSCPPRSREAAARQHSFRTYHQAQQWYGKELNAEQSNGDGKKNKNGLIPVTTLEPPAPYSLLKLISCKCKKGCQKACGCRKAGLKCSVICTNCSNICASSQVPNQDSDEEEETETIFEQVYDRIENDEDCDETDVATSMNTPTILHRPHHSHAATSMNE